MTGFIYKMTFVAFLNKVGKDGSIYRCGAGVEIRMEIPESEADCSNLFIVENGRADRL
jgi:hypothetical protein